MSYYYQIQRMIWKEYRSLGLIWLVVLLVGLMLQALAAFTVKSTYGLHARDNSVLLISFAIPICFSIACAFQMFSGEKSDRTYPYLQFLPIRPSVLLFGKIMLSIVMTVLMGIPMYYLSKLLCTRLHFIKHELFADTTNIILYFSLPLRIFAISLFCSLIASSAQRALILMSGIFTFYYISMITLSNYIHPSKIYFVDAFLLFPMIVFANVALLRPWLRRISPINIMLPRLSILKSRTKSKSKFTGKEIYYTPMMRTIHRFVWKEWKTVRWPVGFAVIGLSSFLFLYTFFILFSNLVSLANHLQGYGHQHYSAYGYLLNKIVLILIGISELAGVLLLISPIFIFQGDHQNKRFRFLTDHGVSPGLFWCLKQALWFTPLLFTTCILYYLINDFIVNLTWFGGSKFIDYDFSMVFFHLLIIYSTFQFASFISTRIYLTGLLAFLGVTVIGFCSLFLFTWNIPYPLVYGPLSALLLFVTFIRMPFWFTERTGWKTWKKSALITIIVIPLTYGAVLYHRVAEVPELIIRHDHYITSSGWTRPNEQAFLSSFNSNENIQSKREYTNNGYKFRTIIKSLSAFPRNSKNIDYGQPWSETEPSTKLWYSDNLKHIPTIIEAAKLDYSLFITEWRSPEQLHKQLPDFIKIKTLLSLHAKKLESENKLKEARDIHLAGFRIDNYFFRFCDTKSLNEYYSSSDFQLNSCLNYNSFNSWINHPKQTVPLLKETYKLIKEEFNRFDTVSFGMEDYDSSKLVSHPFSPKLIAYLNYYRQLSEIHSAKREGINHYINFDDDDPAPINIFAYNFTTETLRTKKLLKNNLLMNLEISQNMLSYDIHPLHHKNYYSSYSEDLKTNSQFNAYFNYLNGLARHNAIRSAGDIGFPNFLQPFIEVECGQKLLLTRIAIKQFEIEKGKLPESLEELVKEKYITEVPSMPYINAPFIYYPYATSSPELTKIITNRGKEVNGEHIYEPNVDKYLKNNPEIAKRVDTLVNESTPIMILGFRHQKGHIGHLLHKMKNKDGKEVVIYSRGQAKTWMELDKKQGRY